MGERRQDPRAQMLRRARVVFRSGHCVVECVVLDLSSGGARLKFTGILALPPRFELRLDSGLSRPAEIRFRGADVAGVQFTDGLAA